MATTAPPTSTRAARREEEAEQSGWVAFAGIMLFIAGFFSFIWGLAGVLNDEAVTVGGQGVLIWDFTAWGWVHILLGAVMTMTAVGLFAGSGWARVFGVIFVTLNAMAQVVAFSAFPLWSLFVLTLDVIVLYYLVARWVPQTR
jgi:hypothetical protein